MGQRQRKQPKGTSLAEMFPAVFNQKAIQEARKARLDELLVEEEEMARTEAYLGHCIERQNEKDFHAEQSKAQMERHEEKLRNRRSANPTHASQLKGWRQNPETGKWERKPE